jgi:hypothetical protein
VIPLRPPAAWFSDPGFERVTPMRVTEHGQVSGHACAWGQCHTGYQGECRTPPHSQTGYAYFLTGEVLTSEGIYVPCGQITLDTTHPDLDLTMAAAKRHMEVTGLAAADVNVGEDAYGLWMAGAVRPTVDEHTIRALRASPVSGHWIAVNGNLELIGLLAVNCQGYPQHRVGVRDGHVRPLAASALGIVEHDDPRRIATRSIVHVLTGGVHGTRS